MFTALMAIALDCIEVPRFRWSGFTVCWSRGKKLKTERDNILHSHFHIFGVLTLTGPFSEKKNKQKSGDLYAAQHCLSDFKCWVSPDNFPAYSTGLFYSVSMGQFSCFFHSLDDCPPGCGCLWFKYVLMLHHVSKCLLVITSYTKRSIAVLQNLYIL